MVDRLRAADLLGRHEGKCAEALAQLSEAVGREFLGKLGDPEIHDLHLQRPILRLEEDVGRLQVAMNDAGRVGVGETHPNRFDDAPKLQQLEGARALQTFDEGFSLEQLEHDDDAVFGIFFDIEYLRDELAPDDAGRPGFAAEPLDRGLLVLRLGAEHFDRNPPTRARVLGGEYFAHPALTEWSAHSVMTREDRALLDGHSMSPVALEPTGSNGAESGSVRGGYQDPASPKRRGFYLVW